MIPKLALVALLAQALFAQTFEQRGYIENTELFYPQKSPQDPGRVIDQAELRWEPRLKIEDWFKWDGTYDFRMDSHQEVERSLRPDIDDRSIRRPGLSIRELNVSFHKGMFTAQIGRQLIRWGKADVQNPTDRFAPKDYLSSVVHPDVLAVTAVRLTAEKGPNSLELIVEPWFTPSRMPLLNQRWTVLPAQYSAFNVVDLGATYPTRPQYGARFNHAGSLAEFSLSYFDGYDNLPQLNVNPLLLTSVSVQRYYPTMRMYGGDFAVPLHWATIKGEAGYFTTTTATVDDYISYVIQLERVYREWTFVGGYSGDHTTQPGIGAVDFSPQRGLSKSFVGRAAYTIDVNRSLAIETAVRAEASFVRVEYSQAFGQHWRATADAAWLRGDPMDFLGQYNHNSYGTLAFRYSF